MTGDHISFTFWGGPRDGETKHVRSALGRLAILDVPIPGTTRLVRYLPTYHADGTGDLLRYAGEVVGFVDANRDVLPPELRPRDGSTGWDGEDGG